LLCQAGARIIDTLVVDRTHFRVAAFVIDGLLVALISVRALTDVVDYEATVIAVADTISVHAVVIRP
jgi:hypothetical protein